MTSQTSRFTFPHTFPRPVYLVMRDYGRFGLEGSADPADTLDNIISQIAERQIDRVVSVTEIFEGRATDITDQVRDLVDETVRRAA